MIISLNNKNTLPNYIKSTKGELAITQKNPSILFKIGHTITSTIYFISKMGMKLMNSNPIQHRDPNTSAIAIHVFIQP